MGAPPSPPALMWSLLIAVFLPFIRLVDARSRTAHICGGAYGINEVYESGVGEEVAFDHYFYDGSCNQLDSLHVDEHPKQICHAHRHQVNCDEHGNIIEWETLNPTCTHEMKASGNCPKPGKHRCEKNPAFKENRKAGNELCPDGPSSIKYCCYRIDEPIPGSTTPTTEVQPEPTTRAIVQVEHTTRTVVQPVPTDTGPQPEPTHRPPKRNIFCLKGTHGALIPPLKSIPVSQDPPSHAAVTKKESDTAKARSDFAKQEAAGGAEKWHTTAQEAQREDAAKLAGRLAANRNENAVASGSNHVVNAADSKPEGPIRDDEGLYHFAS